MGLVYVAPKDRNAYDAVATAKLDGDDVDDGDLSQDARKPPVVLDGNVDGSPSFWAEEAGSDGGRSEGSGNFWTKNAKSQYDNPEA